MHRIVHVKENLMTLIVAVSFNFFFYENHVTTIFLVVEKVTACCQDADVKSLIQLSSIYVQCTPMWPNVYQREARVIDSGTFPFQSYVRSKGHAENRVMEAGISLLHFFVTSRTLCVFRR